jgi:hypothetical protein
MDGHQKIDLPLDKLLVNPENYRFDPVKDQREAMLIMLQSQNNKIIKLARDIALHGLNPSKRLLVKETDGKYVILDGNRRITALKLMTNPDVISGDYLFRSIFEDLHARYQNSLPTVVECAAYPEDQQNIADSWVLLEHTGENQGMGTVSWNSVQKQRFEARHKQQELSRSLQVLDLLETNGIVTEGVEATNLERLLGTRGVPQMLGIDFPKRKKFILVEPQEEVLRRLKKVVEGMSAADFNVGKIYTLDQRSAWIRNILAPQPAERSPSEAPAAPPAPSPSNGNTTAPGPRPAPSPSNGASTPQPVAPSTGTNTATMPPPTPAPTPIGQGSSYALVDSNKTLPPTTPDKIKSIYRELQIVNITGRSAAPHAVGALLRILIEITAEEYLMMKQGFRFDGGGFFRNPAEQGKAYERLDEKLKYIANRCNLPGNVANVLRVLITDQLVITTLNQVMHNTLFRASSTTIKELWQNFEKVFDYLVDEMK